MTSPERSKTGASGSIRMPGKLLLDTSIVVGLMRGDAQAQRQVATATEVFLSSVVLGELYYGAERSNRRDLVIAQVEAFASAATVLPCDADTARVYARIKDRLRTKGRPLPENDIWVAAAALQHDIPLAARDAHFLEIDGLNLQAVAS